MLSRGWSIRQINIGWRGSSQWVTGYIWSFNLTLRCLWLLARIRSFLISTLGPTWLYRRWARWHTNFNYQIIAKSTRWSMSHDWRKHYHHLVRSVKMNLFFSFILTSCLCPRRYWTLSWVTLGFDFTTGARPMAGTANTMGNLGEQGCYWRQDDCTVCSSLRASCS